MHSSPRFCARRVTRRTPHALQHPGFLLWLESFAGTRVAADAHGRECHEYEVGRAADGLLEARGANGRRVPLRDALRGTALVRPRLTFDALVAEQPSTPRRASELTRLAERWPARQACGTAFDAPGVQRATADLLRLGALVERRGREHDAERARVAALAAWADASPPADRCPEEWATLAALATEYARAQHAEPYPIPAAFIFRARRHVEERSGAPLLEYRHAHYRATLVAARVRGGAYELRAASHTGDGQPMAQACGDLESLGPAVLFACDAEPDILLGEVQLADGAEPTPGCCRARASSPLALACLQYQLDDFGTAVRIELEE